VPLDQFNIDLPADGPGPDTPSQTAVPGPPDRPNSEDYPPLKRRQSIVKTGFKSIKKSVHHTCCPQCRLECCGGIGRKYALTAETDNSYVGPDHEGTIFSCITCQKHKVEKTMEHDETTHDAHVHWEEHGEGGGEAAMFAEYTDLIFVAVIVKLTQQMVNTLKYVFKIMKAYKSDGYEEYYDAYNTKFQSYADEYGFGSDMEGHALIEHEHPGSVMWIFSHLPLSMFLLLVGVSMKMMFKYLSDPLNFTLSIMCAFSLAGTMFMINVTRAAHEKWMCPWHTGIVRAFPLIMLLVGPWIAQWKELDEAEDATPGTGRLWFIVYCTFCTLLCYINDLVLMQWEEVIHDESIEDGGKPGRSHQRISSVLSSTGTLLSVRDQEKSVKSLKMHLRKKLQKEKFGESEEDWTKFYKKAQNLHELLTQSIPEDKSDSLTPKTDGATKTRKPPSNPRQTSHNSE